MMLLYTLSQTGSREEKADLLLLPFLIQWTIRRLFQPKFNQDWGKPEFPSSNTPASSYNKLFKAEF